MFKPSLSFNNKAYPLPNLSPYTSTHGMGKKLPGMGTFSPRTMRLLANSQSIKSHLDTTTGTGNAIHRFRICTVTQQISFLSGNRWLTFNGEQEYISIYCCIL
jgi:hypothetical protein